MKNPKHEALKAVVRKIIAEALLDANDEQSEQTAADEQNEEPIEEFSSAGGVAGFTLPLGMPPQPPPSAVFLRRKRNGRKKDKD